MIDVIKKNKKLILITWFFMILIVVVVLITHNKSELKVIDKVELTSGRRSYEKKEEGAWNLTKTAKWVEFRKARIEFNFDSIANETVNFNHVSTSGYSYSNYDNLLVIDTSDNMNEEKIDGIKSAIKDFISHKIEKDKYNCIGVIIYNKDAEIISNLTNNKDELINKIDSITYSGGSNYYKAFKSVEEILKSYDGESSGINVLFITGGYPNMDTPLEVGEYAILKDKYSFIKIKGIQYELGDEVLEPIEKISDSQYVANMTNLGDILNEASSNTNYFKKVEIIDYIHDDFKVESEDDIKPSIGSIKLENENGKQKVIWTIPSDTLRTGKKVNLTIDAILQESAYDKEYVITNDKEEITVKLPDEDAETQKTTIRPTLKYASKVIYNGNSPSDCEISNVPSVKYYGALEPVNIEDEAVCTGYNFKKWYTDKNINYVNKDTFVMPDEDIEFTGTWTKFSLSKSMEGEVNEVNEVNDSTGVSVLLNKANNANITNYENGNKGEMYVFNHPATEQTPALTDYRYIGDEPNNYVYFNCTDETDNSTCEVWRIIGTFDVERTDPSDSTMTITETRMKLVRGSDFATTMKWDNRVCETCSGNAWGKNAWNGSVMNTYLNGTYYDSLSATAQSQIDDAIYYLGGRAYDSTFHYGSTEDIYAWERGTTVYNDTRPTKLEGKVALMYPSDMYMTYAKGVDSACYNDPYYNICTREHAVKGWIHNTNKLEGSTSQQWAWFLSPGSGYSFYVFIARSDGGMNDYSAYSIGGVRPVVYLKSDIKIDTGTGEVGNPYVLK